MLIRDAPHRFFFDDGEHFDELKMYMTLQRSVNGSKFEDIYFEKLNGRGASVRKTRANYSAFEHDFVEYDSSEITLNLEAAMTKTQQKVFT